MSDQELFRIGEVAKLYHISVGTLRHYEQAGLLAPEYTDPATGYRYYSVRQFETLTNIRYLRALDLPLEEIAAYIHNRNLDSIAEKLRNQKAAIARKMQELEVIERKIDNRLTQIGDARRSELEVLHRVTLPACRVVWLRNEAEFHSYLWLEQSIRRIEADQKIPLSYIGKVGVGVSQEHLNTGCFDRYDLVFLLLDPEDEYDGRVEQLPAGEALTIRFRGTHADAPAHYHKLLEAAQAQGLEVTGFSREIALIDNCISDDPDTYVTEISVPVRSVLHSAQNVIE